MKGTGALVLVGLLLICSRAGALFDSETLRTLLRGGVPGPLDLTNILTCTADEGRPFDVPLIPEVISNINVSWRPQSPFYIQIPSELDCINSDFETMQVLAEDLQGINMDLQKLDSSEVNLVDSVITSMEFLYFQINQACSSVYNPLQDIDNRFVIVQRELVDTTNASNVTGIFFSTDGLPTSNNQQDELEDLFQSLQCGVIYRWVDLGPAFLPRFMVAGGCYRRSCSFPIDGGQTCRADLSNIARLPGLRYDCCWRFRENEVRPTFECGWRRVMLPLLCDCDCLCPPRDAGTG